MKLATDSIRYRQIRRVLCGALVLIAAAPSAIWLMSWAEAKASIPTESAGYRDTRAVAAPGRIEPRDGVLTIAAPGSLVGPAIVATLHVHPGDWVESGTVLATLSGRPEFEAALIASQRRIAIANARLDAMRTGGQEEAIQAQRAEVASAHASFAQAQADTTRARQLREQQMLSAAAVETQESKLTVAATALDASRARLDSLSRARPADLAVAQAELLAAQADADTVRAKLEDTLVRAPSAGRVLAIYTHPGQSVGAEGVLAFGRTAQMYVDAEVMEEDLARTQVGQTATITGDVLPASVSGTVEEIGYLVGSREVFKTDPTAFTDSRIVHVKIRVADAARVERFINARVTVEIHR